ncbi:conjugative transfer signal peptidase TraF [Stakelama sediminis]|uniref:Conjugative transfer signal peptidase TraF n=1 Tax=Stakelama sediminis TaxID=463200 RepID=A0A840Z2H9_9SPHN|nr:conjugative transfer signal peptidase TraF [Stakelama sediminis]
MTDRERHVIRQIGDAMRHHRVRRRRLRRRGVIPVLLAAGLGLTVAVPPRPLLVWNASASVPVGLYAITAANDPAVHDMVLARLPARWRAFADARRYVPTGVPLVKRIAATSGDTVCAMGKTITINGRRRAERRLRDGQHRRMPWWRGCIVLRHGAVFLLTGNPASFDGRYFGPVGRDAIIGRAHLLWAR